MGFQVVKEKLAGSIKPITIGKGKNAVTVGGASCYPFYLFEDDMPNKPKIAMEVWDVEPTGWPETAKSHFRDVLSDPAAWAKKCVEKFGADLIVLQLKSIDPNDKNASADDAVKTVKKVLKAITVPLIIWGCANPQKDEEVLKKISEVFQGENLVIGPVEEKNHKGIGASAMGYGHTIISSSPIDVNLAKQINILLENLGMPKNKMIIDPTTGGLGYGLEYSYSVMERIQMAALAQGDDKLQLPFINNLANEIWRCKEANQTVDEAPLLGDPERRVILMESVGAVAYLLAGSSILIMRHPEAVRMVRTFINLITDGKSALDVEPINKELAGADIDFAKMAPEPNLTIEEDKAKKSPAKKAQETTAAKTENKPALAASKIEPPKIQHKDAPKPEATPQVKVDTETKTNAEAEAKTKMEAEAKSRAEAEDKVKLDAARLKAELDAKAEAEAKARAEAQSETRAKSDMAEQSLREKRAKEREELHAIRASSRCEGATAMTPAADPKSDVEKILLRLDRIHRRA